MTLFATGKRRKDWMRLWCGHCQHDGKCATQQTLIAGVSVPGVVRVGKSQGRIQASCREFIAQPLATGAGTRTKMRIEAFDA